MQTNKEAVEAIVRCLTKNMDEDELRERLSDLLFMWNVTFGRGNGKRLDEPNDATLLSVHAFNTVAERLDEIE